MARASIIVGVAVVCGLAACGKAAEKLEESKRELARTAVGKHANELYPQWAMRNSDKQCPASVEAMVADAELDKSLATDPWGTPYKLYCGSTLPDGMKAPGVASFGPDKTEGTADDIKSWDAKR